MDFETLHCGLKFHWRVDELQRDCCKPSICTMDVVSTVVGVLVTVET